MILTRTSTTMGIFALLAAGLFLASDVAAQSQYCQCYDSVNTVRRAPVRHVAYRTKARRTYRTARVRTVYRTVYVPQSRVASYVAYDDTDNCSTPATRVVVSEPAYNYVDTGTLYVTNRAYTSGYDLGRIAHGWGHRDGFKDGWKAALKYRAYDPENNHDYRDADNGYKKRFGSKFLYKTAYREGYVSGYNSGFRSVAGTVVRY